jgi:hypothetical protein
MQENNIHVGSIINGNDGRVYEVVAQVRGNQYTTRDVAFDTGWPPLDRILFIGTYAELVAGTATPVRTEAIGGNVRLPELQVALPITVSDDDWICTLIDAPKKQASYSSHLRIAAEIADDREPQYGSALDNLKDTSMIAKAMFDLELTPVQLAQVMIAFKTSREKHAHKDDNIIDNINYHAILLMAKLEELSLPPPSDGGSSSRQDDTVQE